MKYSLLAVVSFIIIIFLLNISSTAEQNPPPVGGGDSNGDWIIQNTDDITRLDQEIRLKGNLTIEDGGKLTFYNVTLKMNCTKDGEFKIDVKEGGEFYISDNDNNNKTNFDSSIISSVNLDYEHVFYVRKNAKLEMKYSELHECGYSQNKEGLKIYSDDVIIDNNLIFNNYHGIWTSSSDAIITNNSIIENDIVGISIGFGEPFIQNNNFSNNQGTGVILEYDNSIFINNIVMNNLKNGIQISYSTATISNSLISNNQWSGLIGFQANSKIYNNIIMNCNNGTKWYESFVIMSNNTILNTNYYDITVELDSELVLINTTFNRNKIYIDEFDYSLTIIWHLNIEVIDQNSNPIFNAEIRIKDNSNGTFNEIFYTDINGFVKSITCTEYVQNRTARTYNTPHNITISNGEDTIVDSIRMDKSKILEYVLLDTSPPEIYNVESKIDNISVIIIWDTNELSNSLVKYGLSESYGYENYDNAKVLNHIIELNGLELGKVYHFFVNSTDGCGNSNQSDDFTFLIPDIILPQIFNIEYMQITKNSVKIIWSTDEPSNSLVKYGKTESYDSEEYSENLLTSHSINLTGLEINTTYHFSVNSTDESGNSNQSIDFTFTTNDKGDTEPPVNPTFSPVNGERVNNKKPTITITFSEEVTIIEAKLNGIDIKDDLVSSDYTIYTYTPTENLSEGENIISVKAKDMVGNEMSNYATSTFIIDTVAPRITNLEIIDMEYKTYTSNPYYNGRYRVTITWETDEPSLFIIEYYAKGDVSKSSSHGFGYEKTNNFTIRNLSPNRLYYFTIKSEDEQQNANISNVYNFTTLGEINKIDIEASLIFSKTDIMENDNITITANVSNNGNYPIEISIIFMDGYKIIGRGEITVEQKKSKDSSITWIAKKGNHTIRLIVQYNKNEVANGTITKSIVVKEASKGNGDSGFNMIFLIPILIIPIIVVSGLLMRNRGGKEIPQIPAQQNIPQQPINAQQPIQTQTNFQKTATPVQPSSQPGIKKCPYCNAQVPGGFKFCNMCGKVIENEQVGQTSTNSNVQTGFKICPFCNAQVPNQFKLCNMCGKEINS